MTRIRTTHTGSLPRPEHLAALMIDFDERRLTDLDQLYSAVTDATAAVVKRQSDLGLDIVSDGEYGKISYATYVKEQLTGYDGTERRTLGRGPESEEFPDFDRSTPVTAGFPTNSGRVCLRDPQAVRRDV